MRKLLTAVLNPIAMFNVSSQTLRLMFLLVLLVVFWALNMPLAKLGMDYMSPIWLTVSRLAIGSIAVFIVLIARGQLTWPKKRDLPMILTIGFMQMALFQLFINFGMLHVHAGRAAILIYSTPLWVTPFAIFIFGEKMTFAKLIGLLCGIGGILVLFSPSSFNWRNPHVLIGNGMLIASALCWTVAMLYTRYGKWHSKPIDLLPWQLLVATMVSLLFTPFTMPFSEIHWAPTLWMVILFSGILATGFGYYASLTISKSLPVITTSLSMLTVPALTLIFSNWILGERFTFNNMLATALIIGGLLFITLDRRPHN